jgi:hypothetical protein
MRSEACRPLESTFHQTWLYARRNQGFMQGGGLGIHILTHDLIVYQPAHLFAVGKLCGPPFPLNQTFGS